MVIEGKNNPKGTSSAAGEGNERVLRAASSEGDKATYYISRKTLRNIMVVHGDLILDFPQIPRRYLSKSRIVQAAIDIALDNYFENGKNSFLYSKFMDLSEKMDA